MINGFIYCYSSPRNSPILPIVEHERVHQLRTRGWLKRCLLIRGDHNKNFPTPSLTLKWLLCLRTTLGFKKDLHDPPTPICVTSFFTVPEDLKWPRKCLNMWMWKWNLVMLSSSTAISSMAGESGGLAHS